MTSADRLDQLLEMWRRDIDSVPFPEIGLTDIPLQRDKDVSRSYASNRGKTAERDARTTR
ncbi:hypothetical protein SAMN05216266_109111 [Amycolatopsis marina]|uniref:Uncharacterized protein n=1 Tax=Amycolatopsis marina TaxID=490629 RepID=A0A1I1AFX4_9PSEU|nr:hypothetical protein [Amycolatopsis marina]SFB36867.1 hypothetical protein SAMN05216266_109111 [Amycolatopsis marina]